MSACVQYDDIVAVLHRNAMQDPIWFFEEILRIRSTEEEAVRGLSWDLDEWQREMIEAVADIWRYQFGEPTRYNHEGLNKITVRAMHGPGKTFGVAGIMHLFLFVFRGTIVCTAPKEKQLRTRLWPAFRKIRNRAVQDYRDLIKVDNTKIVWCGDEDWTAQADTASDPDNLAGYHDDYLLFIVDEASGVSEEMFPVIEGAVSTGKVVVLLLIGNPTKNTGTFYDSHCNPRVNQQWYRIHVDLSKTSRVSKKWVEEMRIKYGSESPVFKVRCLGDFAESDKNQLIPLQWLYDARGTKFIDDGSLFKLRVSIDVSDGGTDSTVFTIAKVYDSFTCIVKQIERNYPQSEAPILSAEDGIKLFLAYGGRKDEDNFVVDGIGVGAGTAGVLIRKGYQTVVYRGGNSSDDSTKWKNIRTQSYISFRDALRDKTIVFEDNFTDDWDDFCAQVCSIKTTGGDRLEELVTKQQMLRQGIKSPDKADSVAMQFSTKAPTLPTNPNLIESVGLIDSDAYDASLSDGHF